MNKNKILLCIMGVIAVIGAIVYLNSNAFTKKMVTRAAEKQAVAWCSDKYGIEVSVVSTKVHYNNPVMGGFYFFTPNPDYGPTNIATVTVSDGSREFGVYCDTQAKGSQDDYQKDEIMAALREYIQQDLGLKNLARLSCSYGRAVSPDCKIEYLFTGDAKEFLTKHKLSSTILECVEDDFSHLTAEDVFDADSYFSRYVVLLSYRNAAAVGEVHTSIYPMSDVYQEYGEYLDSYCILTHIGTYETEHYIFDDEVI